MKYEILGPLRVSDEERTASVGAPKVETLLALLLSRPNQIVAIKLLIDEIWGEDIPRRATAGIHVYISQARRFLNGFGGQDEPIVTNSPGYILRPGSAEIDYQSFERLATRGRDCVRKQRHAEAIIYLENALALWRGPVLGELSCGPILSGFTTWLTELRMECIETLVDSYLLLGRHRELIGRLYSLIAEYPLREVFYRQLMIALYRSDRQADALNVYQGARQILHDELGLEPCRKLQEIQRAILSTDRRLNQFETVSGTVPETVAGWEQAQLASRVSRA
ncbi:MAG: AfsR/SARP family transcriptional regulator [Trebonia sp.]